MQRLHTYYQNIQNQINNYKMKSLSQHLHESLNESAPKAIVSKGHMVTAKFSELKTGMLLVDGPQGYSVAKITSINNGTGKAEIIQSNGFGDSVGDIVDIDKTLEDVFYVIRNQYLGEYLKGHINEAAADEISTKNM
jgi:hypothetical protein